MGSASRNCRNEGRKKTSKIINLSHKVCDDLIQRGQEPILELRRDSKLWDSPDLAELKNKYKLQKVQPPAKGGPASSFLTSDWRVAQALAKARKVKFHTAAAAPVAGSTSCEVLPADRGKCCGYDLEGLGGAYHDSQRQLATAARGLQSGQYQDDDVALWALTGCLSDNGTPYVPRASVAQTRAS